MPDIQPNNQQPITDDQELAKVLAGVTNQADQINNQAQQIEEIPQIPTMQPIEEVQQVEVPTPVQEVQTPAVDNTEIETPQVQESTPETQYEQPAFEESYNETPSYEMNDFNSNSSDDLKAIREQALHELHPIVDKLNASPEEMFDAYLTLLRSTDDQKLIAPAHEAAKNIQDEAHRAQALLNIIREIDFLSQK